MGCSKLAQRCVGALAILLALAMGVSAAEIEWKTDYEAAKKLAAQEKKDLLIDFTGSDWCIWCKRLDGEVFSKAEFASAAEQFVFVKLDFPRDKSLVTEETRKQNEKLRVKYGVRGYPTIYLTDAAGVPYAKTGYQKGGPANYLKHLAGLRNKRAARDEALAKADKASGADKARLLDEALSAMERGVVFGFYGDRVDEIVKLAGKKSDLASRYGLMKALGGAESALSARSYGKVIKVVDQAEKEFGLKGETGAEALLYRGFAKSRTEDNEGALTDLRACVEAAPKGRSAQNAKMIIARMEKAQGEAAEKTDKK